jgi:hypothetical protein
MRVIRTIVWTATLVSAVFLLLVGNSGCACAPRAPRSEPVAQLIDLLDSEDKVAVIDAQERLRAVTGKKFKNRQQWYAWYDKKVDTVLKQLDEWDTTQYALLRTREYRRLIESLDGQDAEAARIARERLEAATGQRFNSKEDWEKWLKAEVDRLQAKRGSGATTEAFIEAGRYKIAEAVPVLERCMARYTGTGLTHAFLASQTLYLIGTPEAHNVLKVFLPREDYDVGQSITYMYHFNAMPQDAIDSFIRDYHLSSTSDKLKVKLECSSKYNFKVSVTNVSEDEILTYGHFILLFCSPDGYFLRRKFTKFIYDGPAYRLREPLKPGETKSFNIRCEVKKTRSLVKYLRHYESDHFIDEVNGSYGYILSRQGEYEGSSGRG